MQAFFLQADSRRLFTVLHGDRDASRSALILPALFEEMNRCRQTLSRFARLAADAGIATLNIDLFATGDSAGELADSRWETWVDDLLHGLDWLEARGFARPTLLGVRAGCLLAGELLRARPDCAEGMLLWQPVPNGQAVVTELLRMRAVAGGDRGPGVRELRARLAAGETVEAGGYALTGTLASALGDASLQTLPAPLPEIRWLEIAAAGNPPRPVARQLVDRLRGAGARATLHQVADPPFWSTAETTIGQATIDLSLRLLAASVHE